MAMIIKPLRIFRNCHFFYTQPHLISIDLFRSLRTDKTSRNKMWNTRVFERRQILVLGLKHRNVEET